MLLKKFIATTTYWSDKIFLDNIVFNSFCHWILYILVLEYL